MTRYADFVRLIFLAGLIAIPVVAGRGQQTKAGLLLYPGEKHLRNVRQLTFGGQNAEAYFSADDRYLIFQHQGEGVSCDQIYIIPVDTPDGKPAQPKLVSTGKGRTTCGYFFPAGNRILFSSTHAASPECPPKPDYSHGYVWPIYDTYQIYIAKPDGSDLRQLSHARGYNAESTITRDGKKIVFTSTRNGDLDIFTMNADGTHVRQLTHELGYDGGPFWSYDGKKIVYRAEHPKTPEEIADYKALYSKGLIRPGNLEIWVMDADGSHKHQVTHNGAANFAPIFCRTGSASSLRPTWPIPKTAVTSISTSSTRMEQGWSGLPTILTLMPSLCSAQMARSWCGPPTATAKLRTKPTSSLPIGRSKAIAVIARDLVIRRSERPEEVILDPQITELPTYPITKFFLVNRSSYPF